ncbi:hypothetical protein M3J09_004528 [Ascochyta lentis]
MEGTTPLAGSELCVSSAVSLSLLDKFQPTPHEHGPETGELSHSGSRTPSARVKIHRSAHGRASSQGARHSWSPPGTRGSSSKPARHMARSVSSSLAILRPDSVRRHGPAVSL